MDDQFVRKKTIIVSTSTGILNMHKSSMERGIIWTNACPYYTFHMNSMLKIHFQSKTTGNDHNCFHAGSELKSHWGKGFLPLILHCCTYCQTPPLLSLDGSWEDMRSQSAENKAVIRWGGCDYHCKHQLLRLKSFLSCVNLQATGGHYANREHRAISLLTSCLVSFQSNTD